MLHINERETIKSLWQLSSDLLVQLSAYSDGLWVLHNQIKYLEETVLYDWISQNWNNLLLNRIMLHSKTKWKQALLLLLLILTLRDLNKPITKYTACSSSHTVSATDTNDTSNHCGLLSDHLILWCFSGYSKVDIDSDNILIIENLSIIILV